MAATCFFFFNAAYRRRLIHLFFSLLFIFLSLSLSPPFFLHPTEKEERNVPKLHFLYAKERCVCVSTLAGQAKKKKERLQLLFFFFYLSFLLSKMTWILNWGPTTNGLESHVPSSLSFFFFSSSSYQTNELCRDDVLLYLFLP